MAAKNLGTRTYVLPYSLNPTSVRARFLFPNIVLKVRLNLPNHFNIFSALVLPCVACITLIEDDIYVWLWKSNRVSIFQQKGTESHFLTACPRYRNVQYRVSQYSEWVSEWLSEWVSQYRVSQSCDTNFLHILHVLQQTNMLNKSMKSTPPKSWP